MSSMVSYIFKYRVYNKSQSKIHHGMWVGQDGCLYTTLGGINKIDASDYYAELCMGVEDVNGIEIYTNDVVELVDTPDSPYNGIKAFVFHDWNYLDWRLRCLNKENGHELDPKAYSLRVIGRLTWNTETNLWQEGYQHNA